MRPASISLGYKVPGPNVIRVCGIQPPAGSYHVFCDDRKHSAGVRSVFRSCVNRQPIHVLRIAGDYSFKESEAFHIGILEVLCSLFAK